MNNNLNLCMRWRTWSTRVEKMGEGHENRIFSEWNERVQRLRAGSKQGARGAKTRRLGQVGRAEHQARVAHSSAVSPCVLLPGSMLVALAPPSTVPRNLLQLDHALWGLHWSIMVDPFELAPGV